MRFPQTDNSVEDEDSHHSFCLIRRNGFPSSQSSRCLPFLQSWWKHLEFQQFHFLAAGFNIQSPLLNNKHETVSSSDANVIKNDAALAANLLHHAVIFPKAEGVIHPVPWGTAALFGGGGGSRNLCVSSQIHSSQCHPLARASGLSVCFTRCEKSLNFQGS